MLKTWIATHTGLPSFYSTNDIDIETENGRILHRATTSNPTIVSDALAAPGEVTVYLVGGQRVELVRPNASDKRRTVVMNANGLSASGALLVDNSDETEWKSDVVISEVGYARWSLRKKPISGKSRILALNEKAALEVVGVLESAGPVFIGPAVKTENVPLRCVIVNSVSRSRGRLGRVVFDVSWTENLLSASGAVPVLRWEDWERLGTGWQEKTYLELLSEIAGMPA